MVFVTHRFPNTFRPHGNEKPALSNFSGAKVDGAQLRYLYYPCAVGRMCGVLGLNGSPYISQ